jgi:hypothetical protein
MVSLKRQYLFARLHYVITQKKKMLCYSMLKKKADFRKFRRI